MLNFSQKDSIFSRYENIHLVYRFMLVRMTVGQPHWADLELVQDNLLPLHNHYLLLLFLNDMFKVGSLQICVFDP